MSNVSSNEVIALLSYMIDHNKHHEEELAELTESMSDEAAKLVREALRDFKFGNELLGKALSILQNS